MTPNHSFEPTRSGRLLQAVISFSALRTLPARAAQLKRSTDEEKQSQLKRLHDFRDRHAGEAPATLRRLQKAAIDNGNVFEGLMQAVRCCSLGEITTALFEIGGRYRRSM